MNVRITTWKVKTLIQQKDRINEQPSYQRGDVWNYKKKGLLIDSMLRGIDLPKIYLRKLSKGAYEFEVSDGQQRLNSIYAFRENRIALPKHEDKGLDLSKVNGKNIGGQTYEELSSEFRNRFDDYIITIAIIEDATNHEIRTLFGRLQEGDPLVPAEKRNAIISHIGSHIDNFAINHKFFNNSYIPANRFKRQDYMAHALALIAYNNSDELKANLLLKLYLDKTFKLDQRKNTAITTILDFMFEIDACCKTKIYKKFHFIDWFWFLYGHIDAVKSIDYNGMALAFDSFESDRLSNQATADQLIENKKPSKYEKYLYDYILAFRYDGSSPENIQTRNQVFSNLFGKYIKK